MQCATFETGRCRKSTLECSGLYRLKIQFKIPLSICPVSPEAEVSHPAFSAEEISGRLCVNSKVYAVPVAVEKERSCAGIKTFGAYVFATLRLFRLSRRSALKYGVSARRFGG
jgi:hypothetical protein